MEQENGKNAEKSVLEQQEDVKKIDIKKIAQTFSLDKLRYQAAENNLVGNFDENKKYKIYDIIYPELISIKKNIVDITTNYYEATSIVNGVKLKFIIFFNRKNNTISATLNLVEKFKVADIFLTTLTTSIKTISDLDTPSFLQKVRKEFNLQNEEDNGKKEVYIAPPIELMGELVKKKEISRMLLASVSECEEKYVNDMVKLLRESSEGQNVLIDFFYTVKTNKMNQKQENKMHPVKQLLDVLLDDNLENKAVSDELKEKIFIIREKYLEESKTAIKEYNKNKEQEKTEAPKEDKKEDKKPEEKKIEAPKKEPQKAEVKTEIKVEDNNKKEEKKESEHKAEVSSDAKINAGNQEIDAKEEIKKDETFSQAKMAVKESLKGDNTRTVNRLLVERLTNKLESEKKAVKNIEKENNLPEFTM